MYLDVAFITPLFGANLYAGSEIAVSRVFQSLPQAKGTVYCTTLRDFSDRSPRFQEGEEKLGNLKVLRYPPDSLDQDLFTRLTEKMQHESLTVEEETLWIQNCFNSSSLLEDLKKSRHDAYFFTPYLRATTYFGVLLHPSKSLLIPALHNEAPVNFKIFKEWFPRVGGLAFNSASEQSLANHMFDLSEVPQRTLGIPIPTKPDLTDLPLENLCLPDSPYLLYVGRLEQGKGVHELFDWVESMPEIDLVVVGEGDVSVPTGTVRLKNLTEEQLGHCYQRALATCQLSVMESFSQVLFESWTYGTPVIVSSLSGVTSEFCLRSHGGFPVANLHEFRTSVAYLQANPQERDILGSQGKEFTNRSFSTSVLGLRFQRFFEYLGVSKELKSIQFFLYSQNFLPGDAVGNYLEAIVKVLKSHGIKFSIHLEEEVERPQYRNIASSKPPPPGSTGIHWFQYPGYYSLLKHMKTCSGPTILDFHGVTPESFWTSNELSASHRHISMAREVDMVVVHSDYLARELVKKHGVLPESIQRLHLGIDTDFFHVGPPKKSLVKMLGFEGRTILLYVGRLAPNKRIDLVIKALSMLPEKYVLILAGDNQRPEYAGVMEECLELAVNLGLRKRVKFVGKVSDQRLSNLYRSADVFVSASMHEGFGMPFLEAMASGLPCIGSNATAIPETMAGAGILFEPENAEDLAQKIVTLCSDIVLYQSCIRKGLDRAGQLSLQNSGEKLLEILPCLIQKQ